LNVPFFTFLYIQPLFFTEKQYIFKSVVESFSNQDCAISQVGRGYKGAASSTISSIARLNWKNSAKPDPENVALVF
jgi:hypothetical protein